MPDFAKAKERTERTGLPAVEGIAVGFKDAGAAASLTALQTILDNDTENGAWRVAQRQNAAGEPERWVIARLDAPEPPTLSRTWRLLRAIKDKFPKADAEPLLLTVAPVTNGTDAREAFRLWGYIPDDRLRRIQQDSDENHLRWSLDALKVYDANGEGAWKTWEARYPKAAEKPGHGVLIAQPDTGYTNHPRLMAILERNGGNRGKNFVTRDAAGLPTEDALDPMTETGIPYNPGHGTDIASIIAAGRSGSDGLDEPEVDDLTLPWGVAPGAKVLPLRVSSSVIHLSFLNVCDAIDEAIRQNARVISMSLGGPAGSKLLHDKVWEALDMGIIVLAAAGNYVPTVMFPAKIPGVLACAASNVIGRPWRFSGIGGEVCITAPGEMVWHDATSPPGKNAPDFGKRSGDGTSFAVANVAGLAALWLSYHRADLDQYNNLDGAGASGIPFAFRFCLEASSRKEETFIKNGGFGRGIADANALLKMKLPSVETVRQIRKRFHDEKASHFVGSQSAYWWAMVTLPTLAPGPDGAPQIPALAKTQTKIAEKCKEEPPPDAPLPQHEKYALDRAAILEEARIADPAPDAAISLFRELLTGRPNADPQDDDETAMAELSTLAAVDMGLRRAVSCAAQRGRDAVSADAVRRYLLQRDERLTRTGNPALSPALRTKLKTARGNAQRRWMDDRPELAVTQHTLPCPTGPRKRSAYAISAPTTRRLRAYAFDPSLATKSDAAAANEITIPVVFENLRPGPVGDYLEVVDIDPASNCAYAPVDLNHPYLLAQDGLPRSEGNPQFHQQMVYAVAMKTINHFEQALGRPIFWSPLRPWNRDSGDDDRTDFRVRDKNGEPIRRNGRFVYDFSKTGDRFVQRLRLYPHALREQNAYYSPQKRAILFGYFPAGDSDPGSAYPGGIVFTCLAHDIIAHEMTHAILDGMHVHFTEPTNPDVFAFHEAFADIVALFQRFTYPELLHDQIARARGKLDAGTLMSQLALQFGVATGRHQALRDALGTVVEQTRKRGDQEFRDKREARKMDGDAPQATLADAARGFDEENRRLWKRFQADPSLMQRVEEPHERGSFLVAAVFDAYLTIYEDRIADLKRIASGGTGVLPDGDLHPDLVNRMTEEAAKAAEHVLKMCIRAMDYMPPVDVTFGEFLRALITADYELVRDDPRRYRVAFIEAFRKWGIYPRDVRTLSEESLRWLPPDGSETELIPGSSDLSDKGAQDKLLPIRMVRRALLNWKPGSDRKPIFDEIHTAQAELHEFIKEMPGDIKDRLFRGIDLSGEKPNFEVTNLRPARRVGPNGEFLTEMVFEVIQTRQETEDATPNDETSFVRPKMPLRGGVTLVVSMDDYTVRYAIHKRLDSPGRAARQRAFQLRASGGADPDAAPYSSAGFPHGWYSDANLRAGWQRDRMTDPEAMRKSSCGCRRDDMLDSEDKAAKKAAAKDSEEAKKAGITLPNALTEPFALLHRNG